MSLSDRKKEIMSIKQKFDFRAAIIERSEWINNNPATMELRGKKYEQKRLNYEEKLRQRGEPLVKAYHYGLALDQDNPIELEHYHEKMREEMSHPFFRKKLER